MCIIPERLVVCGLIMDKLLVMYLLLAHNHKVATRHFVYKTILMMYIHGTQLNNIYNLKMQDSKSV